MRFTPAAAPLFNLIPKDAGRPITDLQWRIEYPQLIADAKQVLRALVPIERELRDNSRWLLARVLPYRTVEDHIGGVVLTFVDITERRRAEEERAGLLLREREARERAEAAIRTREEVLAIVSHDLRNPLNTISMGAAALADFASDEASRAKYIQMVQRAIQRMNRLIEDLMDVVRLEGGQKLALDPRPLDLAPLLTEMCESFRAQAAPRNQTLVCETAPGLPPVLADRDRLAQVLTNLVGNALKFTPEGGRISLRAEEAEDSVRITVEDTGPGIAPDDLPRIFDPYWQAGRTARLGAGLGLTIAKGIVEGHGGSITVMSKPGEGTTFTFTLPITGPARTDATGNTAEPKEAARR